MNIKYASLTNLNKSLSGDSSFLCKTNYTTKSSTSNLLNFQKSFPKTTKTNSNSVTTIYQKRKVSPQYHTVMPTPRFIEPNLTPAQRKLYEQGNSISPNLNYSNSLGYIHRLDKAKQERSIIYNDKISNKHNDKVIKAKEKESKGYRNVSKDTKLNTLYSDIFSRNIPEPITQVQQVHNDNIVMYKKLNSNNNNKQKGRQCKTPFMQEQSRLAMEVQQKYSDKVLKSKKYLNLTSALDNYSLFSPNTVKFLSYNIKSPNSQNDHVHIKKMFANNGIHVYDIQDNTMGLNKKNSSYNVKVRIDPDNKVSQRAIELIKKKFLGNNAYMKINNKNIW